MSLSVSKCIEGWTNSLKQLDVKADIVFFGDSLTYYGNFAQVFPNKRICNLGLRGDTIQGLIDRIEQVRLMRPSVVYLMTGINDIASNTLEDFKSRYDSLLNCLQAELPGVLIVVQSLLPVNNKDFIISCSNEQVVDCNKVIEELASLYHFKYLDLYSLYLNNSLLPRSITKDGIHLKENHYGVWYRLIKENQV